MATEMLVLVDENDREIGTGEKLAVHRSGALHRAFSIYLFNSRNELLITRRAPGKYHSPGLWTNTCCGHPRPGEPVDAAALRRLGEETGIACPLTPAFHFVYRAEFANGLVEHELDHVFAGRFDGAPPALHPDEADAAEWVDVDALARDVKARPERFTAWLALSLPGAIDWWRSRS
jgi:isopentenyl-diphosphate delta-isomerase